MRFVWVRWTAMSGRGWGWIAASAIGVSCATFVVGAVLTEQPNTGPTISQRGKRFGPDKVGLRVNEHVVIVNDDARFIHTAYVDADEFTFASGDIAPGAKAIVVFPKAGDFTVLCGIHPQMKLTVHVR